MIMLLLLLLLLLLLALSAITSTLPCRISIFNAYLLRCRGLERKRDVNTMKITLDRSKISLTLRTMQTDLAHYTLRGSNHSILAFTIDRLPSMASTFADEIEIFNENICTTLHWTLVSRFCLRKLNSSSPAFDYCSHRTNILFRCS